MSDLVTIAVAERGAKRAELIRGRLETAGITVFLKYEPYGTLAAFSTDESSQVQVQVFARDVERAWNALEEP